MEYDLIIRGGTLVDGTRLPRFRADVGIKDERISKIGRIPGNAVAGREINAAGCIVSPGFIDLHTHYDAQIHWDPYCTISGWHGVTSVGVGNCGFGFAPVNPAERDAALLMMTRTEQIPYETMKQGMPWQWETFPEWLEALARLPKGVNVLSFVPLSPLMIYVMGMEAAKSRQATPSELQEMQRLLHEAMDAGACGFSLQRMGKFSLQTDNDGSPMPTDCMADEHVLAFAQVLRDRDQGFIQITQAQISSADDYSESHRATEWAFLERLAEVAQRPVIHNTINPMDSAPDVYLRELAWVRQANAKGLRVIAQGVNNRNWFTFSLERWNLYDSSPAWKAATLGSVEHKKMMMADAAHRAKIRAEHNLLLVLGNEMMPESCTVADVAGYREIEKYVGRKIGDIAREEGKHPADSMLDIALAGELQVQFQTLCLCSDPAKFGYIMNDPYVLAGASDGGAHVKFLNGGSYPTELLAWLVRDTGQLTLEEAHYHLSYLPAEVAGLTDRGFLKVGARADIVVYDLAKLKRTPEWAYEIAHDLPANEWRCIQRAEGYRCIIVNGVITFEEGIATGAKPGALLRNGEDSSESFAGRLREPTALA